MSGLFRARLRPADGLLSLELAFGLMTLVGVIVFALNLAYLQYVQGAVRAAAVEGAQAGALVDGTEGECQAVATDLLGQLVGDTDDRIGIRCFDTGDTMVAVVVGSVGGWITAVPDVDVSSEVVVVKEPEL